MRFLKKIIKKILYLAFVYRKIISNIFVFVSVPTPHQMYRVHENAMSSKEFDLMTRWNCIVLHRNNS